ncbi:MAG: exopolysaccharide production protein [Glaciihabitans sp.]|nr:exopolysaccharide production protein [Glaciihabitans sp.]
MVESPKFRRWFAVVAFFTVLAGDAWRYSVSWVGFTIIALAISATAIALLFRGRRRWTFNRLPYPMLVFVALVVVSIVWSDYPPWTAAAALTTIMTVGTATYFAINLSQAALLWALGTALRIILAGSLLFELFVATFIRHPILPFWTNYTGLHVYAADYWSRDLLFKGQQIQGIMGNSNLLGFVALLGLIVFTLQLCSHAVIRGWGIFWLVVAATCILLTRSATVTVALVVVAVVAVVLLAIRRARSRTGRNAVYAAAGGLAIAAIVGILVFQRQVLELLGKSDSLTGRTGIWSSVANLASQRPVAGWGWISYWVPFISPFDNSKYHFVIHGVQYLQAHDAWLDVLFQLGVVGLVIFVAFALSTLVRAWIAAVTGPEDGPIDGARRGLRRSPLTLLPVLLLVALLVQSLTESRLLIEYGMFLLALFAVSTKRELLEPPAR